MEMRASLPWLGCLLLCLLLKADGFSGPHHLFQTARIQTITSSLPLQKSTLPSSFTTNHHGSWSTSLQMASYYAPPEDSPQQSGGPSSSSSSTPKKLPTPKIGDIVLYYDLDGGSSTGQTLVGKLSLIQPIKSSNGNTSNNTKTNDDDDGTNKWLVEITQLENVGEGYYAEYPSRKRRKVDLRKLEQVAPLAASFVRTEDAYKVPLGTDNDTPVSYAPYDVRGYTGPMSVPINNDIVEADGILYNNVKLTLFKNTALAGLIGTIIVDLLKGTEDAVIYLAGATAGLLYLYFLGIKTDTVGSVDAKLGANVSNLRFVFPALVLIGVAINNVILNESNPVVNAGLFSTVTPEQFGAAMIGFLTYRIPLFVGNLFPVLFDTTADVVLPGSAGMAVRMAAEAKQRGVDVSALDGTDNAEDGLVTVLLVSGPEGSGKSTLVNRLLEEDDRFVRPVMNDRIVDGIKFELMEQRDEFLTVDESGRYGLSKDGVLQAASEASGNSDSSKVVVIDADVPLAKKLANLPEARLIGVWVGLDSREKFEDRLKSKIRSGSITVSEGETEDSLVRAKMKQAIKDIEYGVVSGVFEFTILNDDIDESVKELKEAAEYCFR